MTKTLTEQFLYGQLLDGYWYINIDGHEDILEVEKGKCYIGGALVARTFMGDKIDKIEVLAYVPSYDEYKRLQEQINEANEAIKLYAETFVGNKNEDGTFTIYVFGSFPTNKNVYGYQELRYDPRPAKKYLEKWGVK